MTEKGLDDKLSEPGDSAAKQQQTVRHKTECKKTTEVRLGEHVPKMISVFLSQSLGSSSCQARDKVPTGDKVTVRGGGEMQHCKVINS